MNRLSTPILRSSILNSSITGRFLIPPTKRYFVASHTMSGLSGDQYTLSGNIQVKELHFRVPFAPQSPETIGIFARAVRQNRPLKGPDAPWNGPWILYLQGGPGYECSNPSRSGYTSFLVDRGYQILFLDQRGTGLSTAMSARNLKGKSPEWLANFRADAIVRDAEEVRKILLKEDGKWSVLGQSFGGFCALHYISAYPDSLKEVFTTGGLPPLVDNPDDVYTALYKKVASRNEVFYKKYPADIPRVHQIIAHLNSTPVKTPNGGTLSPRRFLSLGLDFGGSGGIDTIHNLILRSATELSTLGHLSRKTLQLIESTQAYDENIFYALLHESIYAQGTASNWSAARMMSSAAQEFNWEQQVSKFEAGDCNAPIYFTGEMIYPWMFDDYAELAEIKDVAEAVAQYDGWGRLYDVEQLRKNQVPVYSAIYMEDMYVSYAHAMETARTLGTHKYTISNQHFHDALRKKTEEVLGGLFKLQENIVD